MLTLKELKAIPPGEVFATGVLPNSEEGLYMTNDGGELRWIAKKGFGYNDWAIYCYWANQDVDWIKNHGDKVTSKDNIQKCVPCSEECLNLYRF